jgi:hypothetical protein
VRPSGEEDADDLFVRSLMERRERLRLRKSEDETRKRAFDERMRTIHAGERGDDDDGAPGVVVAAIDRDGADGDGDGREGGVDGGRGEDCRTCCSMPTTFVPEWELRRLRDTY